jgi:hypothetical protein
MSLVSELHAERKARLLRLGFGPKLPPAPLPEPPAVEPACEIEPPKALPRQTDDRDWLVVASANRDFSTFPLLVQEIQRFVAKRFGMKRNHLISARRTADVTLPRQIAMFLSRSHALQSLPEIGRRFGGRDHTTVLHAIRKIERMRARDPEFNSKISALEQELEKTHAGEELS